MPLFSAYHACCGSGCVSPDCPCRSTTPSAAANACRGSDRNVPDPDVLHDGRSMTLGMADQVDEARARKGLIRWGERVAVIRRARALLHDRCGIHLRGQRPQQLPRGQVGSGAEPATRQRDRLLGLLPEIELRHGAQHPVCAREGLRRQKLEPRGHRRASEQMQFRHARHLRDAAPASRIRCC